jgi:starvation-inducible DNA-binding protein
MEKLIQLLEKYQATAHVVALNLHNLHWNLEDQLFFTLHPYLGELYEQVNDYEDEIAEQLRYFGQRPLTTLDDIQRLSYIQDIASSTHTATDALRTALVDFVKLHEAATLVVAEADAINAWAAIEKFSGHLVAIEKTIYFLKSSVIKG